MAFYHSNKKEIDADIAAEEQAYDEGVRASLVIPQQRYSTGEIVRRFARLATARVDWKNGLYYLSNF